MSFKIILIGCGAIAWKGHGPALRQYALSHPDVELAACVDIDQMKAEAFSAAYGFGRAYTDIDEALNSENPDAVSLIVPAPLIAGLAEHILRKGYPLLLEKPPGISMIEAYRIHAAANQAGRVSVLNQVAFNRRYMPLSKQIQAIAALWSGAGKLHHISYDIHRVGRTDTEDASVTAIHGIDVLRQWAGSDYSYIHFTYSPLSHLGETVTNVTMEGIFVSGVTFSIKYFPVSGGVYERAVLTGENTTLHVRLPFWTSLDGQGGAELYSGNEQVQHWDGTEVAGSSDSWMSNGFYGENAAFLDDLIAGRRPSGDIASCLQSVEVAECLLLRKSEYSIHAGIGRIEA